MECTATAMTMFQSPEWERFVCRHPNATIAGMWTRLPSLDTVQILDALRP